MKIVKLLESHPFVVLFLLGSALLSALVDYQEVFNVLFPEKNTTHFEGEICESRDPSTNCATLNREFAGFIALNSGTGVPITLSLKFQTDEEWTDPCENGGVTEIESASSTYTSFIFYSSSYLKMAGPDCMTRFNDLIVPKLNIPRQVLNQSASRVDYIITGKFLVTTDASGTMKNEIVLTEY